MVFLRLTEIFGVDILIFVFIVLVVERCSTAHERLHGPGTEGIGESVVSPT